MYSSLSLDLFPVNLDINFIKVSCYRFLRIYFCLLLIFLSGLSGETFSFLPNGDGPARYRILNFHQKYRNQYEWSTVGFFKDGKLTDVSGRFSSLFLHILCNLILLFSRSNIFCFVSYDLDISAKN